MSLKDTSVTRADRWAHAALDLSVENGLAALSTRTLAGVTGGSPSAITYYFGNRDLLVSQVCSKAIQKSDDCREAGREQWANLPGWSDLASAFIAALQSRLEGERHLLTLMRELEQDARCNERQEMSAAIAEEVNAEARYWQDLAVSYGATADESDLWADLALGLTSLLLSEESAARRSPWISLASYRLQDRLARRPIRFVEDRSVSATELALQPLANETALKILEAALTEIAEKGAEKLSQRDVAIKAGISLSSVTYFFGSKQELIAAAFEELYRQHCAIITNSDLIGDNPAELVTALSGVINLHGLAAFEALLRAAVRLPDLNPTANRVRHTRGVGGRVPRGSLIATVNS